MKFMATWRIHEAKRHDALKTFSQMTTDDDQTDMGSNIKLIGRWHDLQRFTGVAIFDHVEDRLFKRPFQAPRRWRIGKTNALFSPAPLLGQPMMPAGKPRAARHREGAGARRWGRWRKALG